MIQIIPRCFSAIGFGDTNPATTFRGLSDGNGVFTFAGYKHPIPIAGIIRHLVARKGATCPNDVHILLGALDVTLTVSGADQVYDNTHEVVVAPGDAPATQITTVLQSIPGFELGYSMEWEGDQMVFGICASSGSYSAGTAVFGGALGNGNWESFGGGGLSQTYSICPFTGTMTTLMIQRYVSPGGGSFVGYVRKNGVTQDGTGGTVNTTCTLLDSGGATATSTFTLPLGPGDHVDILISRLTTNSAFAQEQIAAGVAVTPTDGATFALCGGSNDSIPNSGTTWKWNRSADSGLNGQPSATAPFGLSSGRATGLYVERGSGPGPGNSYIHRLLRSDIVTDIAVQLSDAETSGLAGGSVRYSSGDTITIQIENIDGPGSSQFHWGLAMTTAAEEGVIGPLLWIHMPREVP